MDNTKLIELEDWTMRVRVPEGKGPYPVLLLLHGLTGDEDVMWVFVSRLPKQYLMIALRAPHRSRFGGYSWYPEAGDGLPGVDAFRGPVQSILDLVDSLPQLASAGVEGGQDEDIWRALQQADFSHLSLVGFSQGAALAYTFALLYPERVHLLAGLAGFLPEGADALADGQSFVGKRVYVTHGRKDDMVPVERAHEAVRMLEDSGAQVTYCEEDVGHKLSATCFRTLGDFFTKHAQRE